MTPLRPGDPLPRGHGMRWRNGMLGVSVARGKGQAGRIERTFAAQEYDRALAWREEAADAVAAGLPVPEPDRTPVLVVQRRTLTQAIDEWHDKYLRNLERDVQPRTLDLHARDRATALAFLGNRQVQTYRTEDVELLRDHLSVDRNMSRDGAKHVLWLVRSAFSDAQAAGYRVGNPAHGIRAAHPANPRPQGRGEVLTYAQTMAVTRLLAPEYRPATWLGRACGLRTAECFGLAIEDLDLDLGVLKVRAQGGRAFDAWDGTTGKAVVVHRVERTKTPAGKRLVGIPSALLPLLREYKATYHPDADALPSGTPFLVSPLRAEQPAAGYAHARRRAFLDLGLVLRGDHGDPLLHRGHRADPDAEPGPVALRHHDLRVAFITELNLFHDQVEPLIVSIVAGHKAPAMAG